MSLIAISTCKLPYRCILFSVGRMGHVGVCGFGKRQPCVVCHDICTFFVLASLTAMSIVCPPGWFMRCIPSRSSFITFPLSILWLQSGRAWCFLDEGMVDNSVLPAISPVSWSSCARVSDYEESNRESHLEEIACSTAADITKLKCVLCVCPYVCNVYGTHTASFFKGRLKIYIYM